MLCPILGIDRAPLNDVILSGAAAPDCRLDRLLAAPEGSIAWVQATPRPIAWRPSTDPSFAAV